MATWLIKRRLTQNAGRLTRLRAELREVDEQLEHFVGDADDSELRALVSETPGAAGEANDARKHADAMRRHRDHLAASIRTLETRQDELLDRLGGAG